MGHLSLSEAALPALLAPLDHSPMPAMVVRKDLTIAWHNLAFATSFSARTGEMVSFLKYQSPANVNALFFFFDSLSNQRSWRGPFSDSDGESARHFEVSASPLSSSLFLLLIHETTRHQEQLENALHSSRSDRLTGLANRLHFNERITQAVQQAHRGRRDQALLMLDLDGFKPVNDTYGHDAGDAVLVEVAKRMRNTIRETDFCARLGGDEFACILTNLGNKTAIGLVADKLIAAIRQPIPHARHTLSVNVSIGISLIEDKRTTEEIIKQADRALYQAKDHGKGCWRFPPPQTQPAPLIPAPAIFDGDGGQTGLKHGNSATKNC